VPCRSLRIAPDQFRRTIGYAAGFVNSTGTGSGCLKRAEKTGNYQRDIAQFGI
jgi:hypothetical protein